MSQVMTTSTGMPVDDNQNSMSAGVEGPLVIQDNHLLDKLAKFDRQRIPERAAHAKGTGAHGVFIVTEDISKYCKAKLFDTIGKQTPVFARFSTVIPENGSADTERNPRGLGLKFYTEEGNWDFVGNSTPVFWFTDPMKFPDLLHSRRKDPRTNLKNMTYLWDFISHTYESCHQNMINFSDRGTPASYRHVHEYGGHTFRWQNKNGDIHWVKIHFRTLTGIKNLTGPQAKQLFKDPDYGQRDLVNHLDAGKTAQWQFFIQAIPEQDALNYKFNVLDLTKVVSQKDYPLIKVGKIIINRNVDNYFAETQQAAFSPGNFVPGMGPTNDRILQARLFSYPDTQRHRLGANFEQIPINCPFRSKIHNGQRDGPMTVNGNQGSKLNYQPNSANGGVNIFAVRDDVKYKPYRVTGLVARVRVLHPDNNFIQPGNLYRNVWKEEQRKAQILNLTTSIKGVRQDIAERVCKMFYKADPELGDSLARNLGFPIISSRL